MKKMEAEEVEEQSTSNLSESPVDDLPNELLSRIFRLLGQDDLNNTSCVSKRWYAIVDEAIGRKLNIGRECQFISMDPHRPTQKYVDISAISQVGVNECFFGEVVELGRITSFWTTFFSAIRNTLFMNSKAGTEFKHPYLVKRLHFDGPLPETYFWSILGNVTNLKLLELHVTTFCTLSTANFYNLGDRWSRLTTLKIWGSRLQEGLFLNYYKSTNILPNVLVLLTNRFRSLTTFTMEYPSDVRDETSLTGRVLTFLKRHRGTLSRFRLGVNILLAQEDQQQETFADLEWIRESKVTSKAVPLQEMELIVNSMRKRRLTKVWVAFLEQQCSLKAATLLSFRIPVSILLTLCTNNEATLTRLFVSRILMIENNQEIEIKCSIFSSCVCLRTLVIEGMMHSPAIPGLIGTSFLPKTLEHLEFGGLPMLHADAHNLFMDLPNLQRLSLTDAGNLGSVGVTLDTLKEVIAERRIPLITMYRSFSDIFPSSGIPNEDPESPDFIRRRPYQIIEFKLNERGYYENLHKFYATIDEEEDVD